MSLVKAIASISRYTPPSRSSYLAMVKPPDVPVTSVGRQKVLSGLPVGFDLLHPRCIGNIVSVAIIH